MWPAIAFLISFVPGWEAGKKAMLEEPGRNFEPLAGPRDEAGPVRKRQVGKTGPRAEETRMSSQGTPPKTAVPTIDEIRRAIPRHCFESSLWISCGYLARDIALAGFLAWAALAYIPTLASPAWRALAWCIYGFAQGLVGTGLWILAHECGHGAFSKHRKVNNCIGWAVHSALLVPYFSWRSTHARHHNYTGHMDRDMAFVPMTREEHVDRKLLGFISPEYFEDVPIMTLVRLVAHQLFGWQAYLLFHVTSGKESRPEEKSVESTKWWRKSHFDPLGAVFRSSEALSIFITDVGLVCMAAVLYFAATKLGWWTTFLLYAVPYLWVHHWLVAITYLHHTHQDVPHYDAENWTYVKGALATIDRDFGIIGRHLFHGIIDTHVVHHLFPRIPFYYAEEATDAIRPLLGDLYHREEGFLELLYPTFRDCKFVEVNPEDEATLTWATN